MTDRGDPENEAEARPAGDFIDDEGPGADPGAGYERATEAVDGDGEVDAIQSEEPPSPGVGEVYRSGS